MALTDAELQIYSDDIAANTDPTVVNALSVGNENIIADWYNTDAVPVVLVWRTAVTSDEVNEAIDWTEYMEIPVLGGDDTAGLKQAQEQTTYFARQDACFNQIMRDGTFDSSLQTIRDALSSIFAGDTNTRTALLEVAKRDGTNFESLFSTGPTQGAKVMTVEGPVSVADTTKAVALI